MIVFGLDKFFGFVDNFGVVGDILMLIFVVLVILFYNLFFNYGVGLVIVLVILFLFDNMFLFYNSVFVFVVIVIFGLVDLDEVVFGFVFFFLFDYFMVFYIGGVVR